MQGLWGSAACCLASHGSLSLLSHTQNYLFKGDTTIMGWALLAFPPSYRLTYCPVS